MPWILAPKKRLPLKMDLVNWFYLLMDREARKAAGMQKDGL